MTYTLYMTENTFKLHRWLTIPEAADYMRLSPKRLYNLRAEGKGPKATGKRYALEELDAWLAAH